MAFGKALEDRIQEVIEGMVHTLRASVHYNYASETWYVEHLRWAMNNNIYFQDLTVTLQNESPQYREFLSNFISYTGEYIQRLDLSAFKPSFIQFWRESSKHMPNVTFLRFQCVQNLPDLDIIELFGHLSLTSLDIWNSPVQYKASQVFSTWPSLHTIAMPLVYDPEMSPALGKTMKSLTVASIDNSNWDLLKYFPNLERVVERVPSENHIRSIAKYCPQIQSLTSYLNPSQLHYLNHLVDCQQLTTLNIDYLRSSEDNFGGFDEIQLQSLPQVKRLRCTYDERFWKACPNVTQLTIYNVPDPFCLTRSIFEFVHLTYLEMNIAEYNNSSWSLFILLLFKECTQLRTFICRVKGTIAADRDVLCDIIGFGHQQLREVYISGEDQRTIDLKQAKYFKDLHKRMKAERYDNAYINDSANTQSEDSDVHDNDMQSADSDEETQENLEIDGESLLDIFQYRYFDVRRLRDENIANSNAAPLERYNCPKLTHIDVMGPFICDISCDQLARCPNLKELSVTNDEVDFRRLLKSCRQVEQLHVVLMNVCQIFCFTHTNLKRLEISKNPFEDFQPTAVRQVGKYPALKDLSLSGEISLDEWQLIVASCQHSRIHRLEFAGLGFMSLFTDSFIETIIQDEAFSELQYFVWSGIRSECNEAQTAFIDALSSAGKGRFSVVLPLYKRKLDVVRRIDFE